MTEPEYTFIKGEGWVATTRPQVIFEHSGQKWILEHRHPEDGEYFLYSRNPDKNLLDMLAEELTRNGRDPSQYNRWPHKWLNPKDAIVYRLYEGT